MIYSLLCTLQCFHHPRFQKCLDQDEEILIKNSSFFNLYFCSTELQLVPGQPCEVNVMIITFQTQKFNQLIAEPILENQDWDSRRLPIMTLPTPSTRALPNLAMLGLRQFFGSCPIMYLFIYLFYQHLQSQDYSKLIQSPH